jgi:hypothetical protein
VSSMSRWLHVLMARFNLQSKFRVDGGDLGSDLIGGEEVVQSPGGWPLAQSQRYHSFTRVSRNAYADAAASANLDRDSFCWCEGV